MANRTPNLRVAGIAAIAIGVLLASRIPRADAQGELDSLIEDSRPRGGTSEAEAQPPTPEPRPPGERRVLEEIIVTAQKREEKLHEVPLAISVLDDDFLNQESLTDLSELSRHVPNVRVLPAAFSPRANIRGFGVDEFSGGNKSVESPIGVAIDGVSYGNKNYLQTGFFDLERIEILRGPQNTLFGKNNSVGLFSLVTKRPTDELTGFVDAEYGEPERKRFEGAAGGPALPGWINVRIAGLWEERGGFKRNTSAAIVPAAGSPLTSFDRRALRVKAEVPDLLGANVLVSYEHFEVDVLGIGLEFAILPESTRGFFQQFDPNTDFEWGNFVMSSDFPSLARFDVDTWVANVSYPIGEWGLDLVAGHSILRTDNQVDADTGPMPMIFAFSEDTNPQTTFELRTTSPDLPGLFGLGSLWGRTLGRTDFTSGIFYQRRQVLDSEFTTTLDSALVGAIAVLSGSPLPPGVPAPPQPIARETVGSTLESTTMFWEETTNTVAGYGQARWHFADDWTLTGGMRLGNEWKEADWNRILEGPPAGFLALGGFEEFSASRSRSEFQYAPQLNLRYDVTDEVNVFAGWARGFRGGGLNEFAQQEAELEFDPEEAINYELGTNAELLEGTARASLTLFHTTINDFQLVTTGPQTNLVEITKAGKARSQGLESDFVWLPYEWLTLRGTFAFIDAEFVEFPFGPCTLDNQDSDGDAEEPGGDPRCDLSGRALPRAPRWATTLTPAVNFPFSRVPVLKETLVSGIEIVGGITVEYLDTTNLDLVLDPRTRAPSFFRVDGHLGFEHPTQGWSLRATMMNMTDVLVSDTSREMTQASGHFVWSAIDPRHVFGEFRWRF